MAATTTKIEVKSLEDLVKLLEAIKAEHYSLAERVAKDAEQLFEQAGQMDGVQQIVERWNSRALSGSLVRALEHARASAARLSRAAGVLAEQASEWDKVAGHARREMS